MSLFSLFNKKKPSKDEFDKLRRRIERGRKLLMLTQSEGWEEMVRLRESIQENALKAAISLSASDKERLQASVQFSTIESLFSEISRRLQELEKDEKDFQESKKKG